MFVNGLIDHNEGHFYDALVVSATLVACIETARLITQPAVGTGDWAVFRSHAVRGSVITYGRMQNSAPRHLSALKPAVRPGRMTPNDGMCKLFASHRLVPVEDVSSMKYVQMMMYETPSLA